MSELRSSCLYSKRFYLLRRAPPSPSPQALSFAGIQISYSCLSSTLSKEHLQLCVLGRVWELGYEARHSIIVDMLLSALTVRWVIEELVQEVANSWQRPQFPWLLQIVL